MAPTMPNRKFLRLPQTSSPPPLQMLYALLAAFFFACSGVCGQRSSSLIGPVKANFLRLAFASLLLSAITMILGGVDLRSSAACRLYLSGLVGFGMGDMALFFALPRLGARLTLLINLCTAPLFGSLGDYLLLGTVVKPVHAVACILILAGVVIALTSQSPTSTVQGGSARWPGVLAALIAGLGQGTGATLSRHAHSVGEFKSVVETCLRVVPGMMAVGCFWLAKSRFAAGVAPTSRPVTSRAAFWVVANALCGAVLGVTCFQRALTEAPSSVVLSITATTPVLVMPMTFYSESDHPSLRSIGGATIAVMGVVLLKLLA